VANTTQLDYCFSALGSIDPATAKLQCGDARQDEDHRNVTERMNLISDEDRRRSTKPQLAEYP
jgi:hypothetical protein